MDAGLDIPSVNTLMVEVSEEFGLSQLYQLRGRVGRDDHQSYCFLSTTSQEQASSERLKAMEQYDSGFQLAEIDLKLRGPGELYGLRQSGMPEIRAGSLMNPELVVRARRAAEKTLDLAGKGKELMPVDAEPSYFSAKRYYELYRHGSVEGNIFNYEGSMKFISKINSPILTVFGSKEDFAVITPRQMLKVLAQKFKNKYSKTALVKDADHCFCRCEEEVEMIVSKWLRRLLW